MLSCLAPIFKSIFFRLSTFLYLVLFKNSFTGIVYDERMLAHKNEVSDHPECPKRISYIWKELVKEGVVECCKRVEAREATEEEILLVHT